MTTEFTIVSGKPSSSELAALNKALAEHKRVEPNPVVRRSNWAQPIMRASMPQAIKFGAGRNV